MRLRLTGDKSLNQRADALMHLGRVIDAERRTIGAEDSQRLAEPDFRARVAQNPIDDRSFRFIGRGDAGCVRTDVVVAPFLTRVVGERVGALGDARDGLTVDVDGRAAEACATVSGSRTLSTRLRSGSPRKT